MYLFHENIVAKITLLVILFFYLINMDDWTKNSIDDDTFAQTRWTADML